MRAVHLEVVTDLSTQSFVCCLSRFIARRGLPSVLITDNAKTFKSARKILRITLSDPIVAEYLNNKQIQWDFNLELAPWWGGFFERFIGLMKRCLKKTLGRAKISYDEICTLVAEIESILNSHPLTYISTEDTTEPLTPSHLLTGHCLFTLPKIGTKTSLTDVDYENSNSPKLLTRRLNYLNKTIDHSWTRWRREYLVALRDSHKYKYSLGSDATIKTGQVCIVFDASVLEHSGV